MIYRHLLVWASIWLSHVQAQVQPILERSIILNKHEWQVEFNLTDPINDMKRFDISVGGTKPEEKSRLFRFEFDRYYTESYKWYLRNGSEYIDGRCGLQLVFDDKKTKDCNAIQWNSSEIVEGYVPEFFPVMDSLLYPPFLPIKRGLRASSDEKGLLKTIRVSNTIYQIATNKFETMLRIEIGTLRKTVYLEHSVFESGADLRIRFWNDHPSSGIDPRDIPELQEIPNDKIIRANDLITETEWKTGTWAKYLGLDIESLDLFPNEDVFKDDTTMKIGIGAPKAYDQTGLFGENDYTIPKIDRSGNKAVRCVKYRDDQGLLVVETAKNGFEKDWTLGNDFTSCNFEMKCEADAYAMYNLRGFLSAKRTESLKVDFGETKLSLSDNPIDSNFPNGGDWIVSNEKSVSLRLVMNKNMVPAMIVGGEHGFIFKQRCLKGVILDSGKLVHPVEGLQTGYNEASQKCTALKLEMVEPESSFENEQINNYLIQNQFSLGFWLKTQERYNNALQNPTIKRIPFAKYQNFKDPTLDAQKVPYAISLNELGWIEASLGESHGVVCQSTLQATRIGGSCDYDFLNEKKSRGRVKLRQNSIYEDFCRVRIECPILTMNWPFIKITQFGSNSTNAAKGDLEVTSFISEYNKLEARLTFDSTDPELDLDRWLPLQTDIGLIVFTKTSGNFNFELQYECRGYHMLKEADNLVDAIVFYDWEPPEAILSDVYLESGFDQSCESRGFETITGVELMGRGDFGGKEDAIPTLPENYNMTYIGERSNFNFKTQFWDTTYGQGQMGGGSPWKNMIYANQTAQLKVFDYIAAKQLANEEIELVWYVKLFDNLFNYLFFAPYNFLPVMFCGTKGGFQMKDHMKRSSRYEECESKNTLVATPHNYFDNEMLYWTKTCKNPNEIVYFKVSKVEMERYADTLVLGSMRENNTIDEYKFYGQGGPGQGGQIYTINGSRIEIRELGYNDADLNWETFNSPRFFGNFRANNHVAGYYGMEINMTCHEPLDFPTKTLMGNECLNWEKFIFTNVIDEHGFKVQHLVDKVNLKGHRVPYYKWNDNRCRQIEPEGEYGCYIMQNQTYYDESGNCSAYKVYNQKPGTINRPDCPAFVWETCENDPALDLDIIAWEDCPVEEVQIDFEDPPPLFLEVTEDSLLARFNELSDAELETTFGMAPSAALNGYVTRVDLCNIQAEEYFSTNTSTFLHRAEVMRTDENDIPGRTQELQFKFNFKDPSLAQRLNTGLTKSKNFIGFYLNITAWQEYLDEGNENTLVMDVAKKIKYDCSFPSNTAVECCQDNRDSSCIEKFDGTHILVVTQNCEFQSQQSNANILAVYRNFLLRVDKNLYANESFKDVLRKEIEQSLNRVFSGVSAVLRYIILPTSRQIIDTSLCSETDASICLIYEFEITVDTTFKMLNGKNLDSSLDDGIDRLKEDLNEILAQKTGQYAFEYISGSQMENARQTPNSITLEAKQLRRSGQNIVGRFIMIYIVTVMGTLVLAYSYIKFGSFIWMCDLISRRFGNSAGEKFGVRVSLTILFVGIIGFVFECINAFEYLRGTRLYISDPGKGIATALFILCIMRLLLILLNWLIWLRRWKAIFINFVDSYTLTLVPPIDDFLRLLTFTSAVILHDAIYQFLRIFYYSRFKPPSLSITPAQFAMPLIEVILVLGPILTIVTQFKAIISSERLKNSSTIQFIAPAYLGSASILIEKPGKIDNACRYLLKTARNEYQEAQKGEEWKNKLVLIIMKIILPLSFITMKLLGCFIDFMISLINSESTSNVKSIPSLNMTNFKSIAVSDLNEMAIANSKEALGTYLTDSFSPRTCIRPTLTEDGQDIIVSYQSRTTQRVLSDEGRDCLNDIELAYLIFLAFTLFIGLVSVIIMFRMGDFRVKIKSLIHRYHSWLTLLSMKDQSGSKYDQYVEVDSDKITLAEREAYEELLVYWEYGDCYYHIEELEKYVVMLTPEDISDIPDIKT